MYEIDVYNIETLEERTIYLHTNTLNPLAFSRRDKEEYPWLIEEEGKWAISICVYID